MEKNGSVTILFSVIQEKTGCITTKMVMVYCFRSYFSVGAFMVQSLISDNVKFSWGMKSMSFSFGRCNKICKATTKKLEFICGIKFIKRASTIEIKDLSNDQVK